MISALVLVKPKNSAKSTGMGNSKPLCPHERTPFLKETEVIIGRTTFEASAWCHECGSLEVTKGDNLRCKLPKTFRSTSFSVVKSE